MPQIPLSFNVAFGMYLGVHTSSLSHWCLARQQPCGFSSLLNMPHLSSGPFCRTASTFCVSVLLHHTPSSSLKPLLRSLPQRASPSFAIPVSPLLCNTVSCALVLFLYNYLKLELIACCVPCCALVDYKHQESGSVACLIPCCICDSPGMW